MSDYPAGKQLVEGGHVFEVDEDEKHGVKYYDVPDYHGGPQCIVCREWQCQHCNPDFLTERCDEAVVETLPGLEFA